MQYLQISRTEFNALFSATCDFLRTDTAADIETSYYQSWGVNGKKIVNFNTGKISYYRTLSITC